MNKLEVIRESYKNKVVEKKEILVCGDTGCAASKSNEIIDALKLELKKKEILDVEVIKTGCFGLCSKGPFAMVMPDNICYGALTVENAKEIVEKHIMENQVVEKLLVKDFNESKVARLNDLNFYKKQDRRVLGLCNKLEVDNIDSYIANDGYKALEKVLSMNSIDVINELKLSNLRGRGGAGYPTGLKWEAAYNSIGDVKYIVCNADEGDPGAFMDRSILEGTPHQVIEAMIIAGFTIKASIGYIYIRAEYPKAVERLKNAIKVAYEYNLLGSNILDSDYSFDLEIRLGAGAFVCGEETALLESIEGKKGTPRGKPPFPTDKGLFGCPTLINNVETYANVPSIILKGSSWYKSVGSELSGGTKVFALGGNVVNTGLVEVPIGITLREIVYDIGGGVPNGKYFKAAQTGGPSGGCLPYELLDIKMDYESLKEAGSMMGSGGLIVMDNTKCMVSLARFYLEFSVSESCGKCTPCRIGVKRMKEILDKICTGTGTMEDLDELEKLANIVSKTSVCGLGQSAPNPVISTLRYFKDEYINHIENKVCDAGECKLFSEIFINDSLCKKCGACKKICPSKAIEGNKERGYKITDKCVKCEICLNKCPFKAIERR